MGKRRQQRGNIENVAPEQESYFLDSDLSPQSDSFEMKTRSSAKIELEKPTAPPTPNPVDYPTAVLLQEIAHSASTSNVIEVEVPYDIGVSGRSPLAESSYNELTPEKQSLHELHKTVETSTATQATPTANLKILCDAVDHDETVSSEGSIPRGPSGTEPVTPTTNLKMLITAASPEIRSLELSKSRLFTDEDEEDDDIPEETGVTKKVSKATAAATRKQKSLGILCRK